MQADLSLRWAYTLKKCCAPGQIFILVHNLYGALGNTLVTASQVITCQKKMGFTHKRAARAWTLLA